MKLVDIIEAVEAPGEFKPEPASTPNQVLINGTAIDPLLRRSLTKYVKGARLQRNEATALIQAFIELLKMEPTRTTPSLRALRVIADRALPKR